MANASDARFRKSEQRLQEALARMLVRKPLAEIGVSELAREADVSRATFYMHYDNVGDVFEQLVADMMANVRSFGERFCVGGACGGSARPRYCERLRMQDELSGVTRDPGFSRAVLARLRDDPDMAADAADVGVSARALYAVRLFQMSGCHAVATSELAERGDWEQTRAVIDAFIEGGMNAIRGM